MSIQKPFKLKKCAARGTGSKPNYLHPPPPWHGIWNGKLYWFIWNEILIIIKPPLPHKMWWNSKFPQVIETIVDKGLEIWETRQQKVEIKRGAKVIVPPPRVHCNTGHLRWQDSRADCVSKSVQKVALKGYFGTDSNWTNNDHKIDWPGHDYQFIFF